MLYPSVQFTKSPKRGPDLELAAPFRLCRLVPRELHVRDVGDARSAMQVLDERVDGCRVAVRFALDIVAAVGDP